MYRAISPGEPCIVCDRHTSLHCALCNRVACERHVTEHGHCRACDEALANHERGTLGVQFVTMLLGAMLIGCIRDVMALPVSTAVFVGMIAVPLVIIAVSVQRRRRFVRSRRFLPRPGG